MEKNKLKQSIGILYDMELNNYLMTKGIYDLQRRIDGLGYHQTYSTPIRKHDFFEIDDAELLFGTGIIGGIIGGIVGLFMHVDEIGKTAFFGMVAIMTISIVGKLTSVIISNIKYNKAYNREVQYHQYQIIEDNKRVERENKERQYLCEQQRELKNHLINAENETKRFYRAVGIDPKYQNIVAIGYMNEFIRLGISNKLEGVDGLYYLMMKELRMDQMQHTLEEISQKLDSIIDNQRAIYSELVSINNKCDRLISNTVSLAERFASMDASLEAISQSSDITAYYAERVSRMQEYEFLMRV